MTTKLCDLLHEQASDLLNNNIENIQSRIKESADGRTGFTIKFKILTSATALACESYLSWSDQYKSATAHGVIEIDDPKQPGLPLDEGSVTIKAGDKEVTMTQERFRKISKQTTTER
jgi:hypothetical protein